MQRTNKILAELKRELNNSDLDKSVKDLIKNDIDEIEKIKNDILKINKNDRLDALTAKKIIFKLLDILGIEYENELENYFTNLTDRNLYIKNNSTK